MAGREGFEPSRELYTPYPLSRRVLSTTQPPPRPGRDRSILSSPAPDHRPPYLAPDGSPRRPRRKVWYTLADGTLSEVFFPLLDHVALHELRFFASAGGAPPVDDSADGEHSITWLAPGVPAFRVETTHHEYRLTKEFFSDPEENAVLVAATFTPELPDLRLYMHASAHWQPS